MVRQDVNYLIRMEPASRRPSSTLEIGQGSCRDSAWLLVQVLRYCGIAARFASGYLISSRGREAARRPRGSRPGFHRPARVVRGLRSGAGWIGLDATSDCSRAKATSRLRARRSRERRRPSPGATEISKTVLDSR
jgi:transglutaminase-like putative cysteine protease